MAPPLAAGQPATYCTIGPPPNAFYTPEPVSCIKKVVSLDKAEPRVKSMVSQQTLPQTPSPSTIAGSYSSLSLCANDSDQRILYTDPTIWRSSLSTTSRCGSLKPTAA